MITLKKHPSVSNSLETLRTFVDNGKSISFVLTRIFPLTCRDCEAFLNGADIKASETLCEVKVSPTGYKIKWRCRTAQPSSWLGRSSLYDDAQFDAGIAEIEAYANLTLSELVLGG